jgi:hypothetical protein
MVRANDNLHFLAMMHHMHLKQQQLLALRLFSSVLVLGKTSKATKK